MKVGLPFRIFEKKFFGKNLFDVLDSAESGPRGTLID